MEEQKPFLLDISGTTCIGNTSTVVFDISLGVRVNGTDQTVYASLQTQNPAGISLPALIQAFSKDGQPDIPDFLQHLPPIVSLTVTYGTGARSSEFRIAFDTLLTINGKTAPATITADYLKAGDGSTVFSFGGRLRLGSHTFAISFRKTENAWYLYAAYDQQGAVTLNLRDMAGRFFDHPEFIPDASLELEQCKAFLLYRKAGDDTALLVGLGAAIALRLDDLPLAGPVFTQGNAFAFKEVLALYASGSFTATELQPYPVTAANGIGSGFSIAAQLLINGKAENYILHAGAEKAAPVKDDPSSSPAATDVTALGGEISSQAKWTKVDKKIGPVTLQRLGFLFREGRVILLLDASMLMGGMGMQLVGLGLGFKLEWKWPPAMPEFYIDGVGLSYTKDPVRISGMFVRAKPVAEVEQYAYYGAAQLSLSKFAISGMGAYSKLVQPQPEGAVSFFIYAMYAGAIGGPAFFFVTGIAAGFGYNRRVKMPAIREVNTFPLVTMAINPDATKGLNDVLGTLVNQQWIPASPGDYWLAVGIRFSSFQLIDSFILVIAQFGTRTEFAILGLSVLAWPTRKTAIAYVELAVKASFGTDSDVIAVEAMLTSNSYLLDKNCKLTGGFAFYVWVAGEHEGDFVITLGGYHPKFNKPPHYPIVDRLGLNWKISDQVQIKGGMYYALTPGSIMAGGMLEVTFNLRFLSASIVAWLDMCMAWAPFGYAVDMGIRVKIEADIEVALFTVHFKLEMGAMLHIWGPPFAGEAHVNWNIFSFTIPFGKAARTGNQSLDWAAFKEQFLPVDNNQKLSPEIIIRSGVISEYKVTTAATEVSYLLVNPHQLQINIETPLPVTTVTIADEKGRLNELDGGVPMQTEEGLLTYNSRNLELGIRPMQQTQLQSVLQVRLLLNDAPVDDAFQPEYTTYTGGVPSSLWSQEPAGNNNNTPEAPVVLKKALKGITIASPKAPVPQGTPQLDLSGRLVSVGRTLSWGYVAAVTGPDNTAFSQTIKEVIMDTWQQTTDLRKTLIEAALHAQGIAGSADEAEKADWVEALQSEPVVVPLGGLPQYKNETAKQ